MLTQGGIKDLVLVALAADTALTALVGTRIDWLARPVVENTFPRIVYTVFDTSGNYSFGNSALVTSSEDYTFQLDVYSDPNDSVVMDDIITRIKAVMVNLCFRNTSSPGEFLEEDINKIVRSTRWDYINV